MHFRMHACMHLPTYCSTIAFDILSYTPPHIGEGLIYMAKTKAKQSSKQTAGASQPTDAQLADGQPVGARRRVFWIGIACALAGAGLWGVEFFLSHEHGVYFSELSPRPHDTGMVTLAGTQNLNEFELHCRAVLGLPIPRITLEHTGASAVILSPIASREQPRYRGEEEVCREENTDLRIFGKPSTKLNRRMGVVVRYDALDADLDALRDKTKAAAAKVEVY